MAEAERINMPRVYGANVRRKAELGALLDNPTHLVDAQPPAEQLDLHHEAKVAATERALRRTVSIHLLQEIMVVEAGLDTMVI